MIRPNWTKWSWPRKLLALARRAMTRCKSFLTKNYGYLAEVGWWKGWYYHPNLDDPSEEDLHAEAESWALNYIPVRLNDDEVYNSALKYAERQYDQAFKLGEALDKKLDDLWKNASALGAILAAVTKLFPLGNPLGTTTVLVPALLLLAATVILAAHTRGPASIAIPMSARAVLDVIELNSVPTKAQVEGSQAASYYFATVGMNRVNLWKSTQLKRATIFFCLGLFLLVLSMVFAGPSARDNSSISSPQKSSSTGLKAQQLP